MKIIKWAKGDGYTLQLTHEEARSLGQALNRTENWKKQTSAEVDNFRVEIEDR